MNKKKVRNAPVLLAVIAAGTVLNLAGAALATAVWPQLYFDSLGTILAAALCGYIPGILVGFITNMLKGITDHISFYDSALNALIAIAALNNGLEAFKYNILFSCHDHQLTQTVANRIIELTEDGFIDRMMSYDEYMHLYDRPEPER